jgi:hypothetical protein
MISHRAKPENQKIEAGQWRWGKSLIPRFWTWLTKSAGWEIIAMIALAVVVPTLLFYNLGLNPRTWHDEGDALSLARTLAEDGFYGVKVSDGYQTFGIVQSVGPTIILPAALVFKTFGVGLIQGRIIAVVYALLTLVMFFWVAKMLISRRAAIFCVLALLGFPGIRFFYTGRQVLGVVPALGFFLAGFLLWMAAAKSKRYLLAIVSGLLIGGAILTKSQYLVIGIGTFALIFILDLLYYRLGTFKVTAVVILVALVCYSAWNLWQWNYYGEAIYLENADKLVQLGQVAFGFKLNLAIAGIRVLFGTDTGHYFLFWGWLSLLYVGFCGLKKDIQNMGMACLLIFTCLWLGFAVFWSIPWLWHFFAPLSATVLLVGKVYEDLTASTVPLVSKFRQEIVNMLKLRTSMPMTIMPTMGSLIALLTLTLWTGYSFEKAVSLDVLDRVGEEEIQWPRPFSLSYAAADFLNQHIEREATIETSERELAVLTDLTYHSPDQSILIEVIPYAYSHSDVNDYRLGREYFGEVKPSYLVIGYFAKAHDVYDMHFVLDHYELIYVIGDEDERFGYEIYRLKNPWST